MNLVERYFVEVLGAGIVDYSAYTDYGIYTNAVYPRGFPYRWELPDGTHVSEWFSQYEKASHYLRKVEITTDFPAFKKWVIEPMRERGFVPEMASCWFWWVKDGERTPLEAVVKDNNWLEAAIKAALETADNGEE